MFEENEVSAKSYGGTELTKRGLAKHLDPILLDNFQIICSRVRELKEDKIRIWWIHDTEGDPECIKIRDENFRAQFHNIVFTSEYQYNQFRTVHGLPYDDKFLVIESGVDPLKPEKWRRQPNGDKPADPIKLIYTSTPQRGLGILLPVVDQLSKHYPEIHLDVFSSFKLYGWDEMDKQFEAMYDYARKHPNITYHEFSGADSNDKVRKYVEAAHIFAYPCMHPETFCRSLVEAMSAQCLCVHPNFAALPFTSGGLNIMYAGSADHQKHFSSFGKHLDIAIRMVRDEWDIITPRLQFNKAFVDTCYATSVIANKWTSLCKQLVQKYPTPESRAIPAPMFRYSSS